MSHRVLPARGRNVSGTPEIPSHSLRKVLPFPAPIFASFAEAERHSAPAHSGGEFLLGVCFAFAFEAVAALLLYGAWHYWQVLGR
jgi:hypothetical protein